MDENPVEGAAHRVKGAAKEAVGKITGDAKKEAESAAEKGDGQSAKRGWGAKDAVRDSLKN